MPDIVIAGKAKYKRMIELDNTMLFVYANPEPMLSYIGYYDILSGSIPAS